MQIAQFCLGLVCGLASLAAHSDNPPRLGGTLVQYQDWMMTLDEATWKRELDAMKAAGVRTIVLQYLHFDKSDFFGAHGPNDTDPTEMILDYADDNGMQVWLGLGFTSAWWQKWDDANFLRETSRANQRLAYKLWKLYGDHESFGGWYIPFEFSDFHFKAASIKRFRLFLSQMSRKCKRLSGRNTPVGLSVFFQAKEAPEDTAEIFRQILTGSGVDTLMVQDGVGANAWERNLDDIVVPFLQAFAQATRAAHVRRIWAVAESFKTAPGSDSASASTERLPMDAETFQAQINSESPWVDNVITFDFFHYMSPFRGPKQKKLYDDFMALQPVEEQNACQAR